MQLSAKEFCCMNAKNSDIKRVARAAIDPFDLGVYNGR